MGARPTEAGSVSATRSILIFDDGLRGIDGHFYEYDLAVAALHCQSGDHVTIICHKTFDHHERLEALGVEVLPVLDQTIWLDFKPWPGRLREIPGIIKRSRYFARVLREHLASRQYDLVFAPNAMISDVLAWTFVRLSGLASRVKRMAMLFRFSVYFHPIAPGVDPDVARPAAGRFLLWRLIFMSHRRAITQGKVLLLTDSLRLAKQYQEATGACLRVVPSPRTLPEREPRPCGERDGPMVFAMVGHSRWARGIDLFAEAAATLIESGRAENLHFVLQWHVDVRRPDWSLYELDPILKKSDRVTIIDRALSSDDYDRLFDRLDCMVLPYRRAFYYAQISGVAIETACAGIPMIVTEDCWLADYLADQGAGSTIPDEDADALAEAILKMAAAHEHYSGQARTRGILARGLNTPDQFRRLLWGEPEVEPAQPSQGVKSSL